jgi:hypothetical protein
MPVMMDKRRGTAQIATASLGVCAASNRHKNLLFSQLARSLNMLKDGAVSAVFMALGVVPEDVLAPLLLLLRMIEKLN